MVINGVTGDISWNGTTITLVPSRPLSYGSSYTVVLEGTDLAGNAISGNGRPIPRTWARSSKGDELKKEIPSPMR